MDGLESGLERARSLRTEELASAIRAIGFDCTRCGTCCRGTTDDPHTATIFPREVRAIQDRTDDSWVDVARPMPFGLTEGTGETFEWALQTDECGDCRFLERDGDGTTCSIYETRPRICQTYPFSVALPGTEDYDEAVVTSEGPVQAHECPGLGRDIDRADALDLAEALRERAIREIEEAIAVRDAYDPEVTSDAAVVVHDSEGAKHVDGRPLEGSAADPHGDG